MARPPRVGAQSGEWSGDGIEMQRQIFELRSLVERLAQANALQSVVENGFETLGAMLSPLKELGRNRTQPSHAAVEALDRIRFALKRPDYGVDLTLEREGVES